jgi:hypothetical protein
MPACRSEQPRRPRRGIGGMFILGGAATGAAGGAKFKGAVGTVIRVSRRERRAEALTGTYLTSCRP